MLTAIVVFAAIKIDNKFLDKPVKPPVAPEAKWQAPDINKLPPSVATELVKYGKELIANTSYYLGPKGTVAAMSNGLNCQNCHLDAGTRLDGNCFAMVATSYPKYRDRSGRVETIAFRINECMERSLNGKELDSTSREMQAMIAYIKWIGTDVTKATPQKGIATIQIPFMDRAANPAAGQNIYIEKCQRCHAGDGNGLLRADSTSYEYPPLWGANSYNVSAGMHRLTRLAAFIKYNMPYLPVKVSPQLTDEEAWDVAAFISTQQRPEKFFKYDWGKLNTKPVDYPFAPFADSFSITQHKYGPFKPINEFKKMHK